MADLLISELGKPIAYLSPVIRLKQRIGIVARYTPDVLSLKRAVTAKRFRTREFPAISKSPTSFAPPE